MKLAVVGAGYVGLTSGLAFFETGHEILFVESDAVRRDALASGHVPFFEPGLQELLRRGLEERRVRFASSATEAAACEVALLAVATPISADGTSDVSALSLAAAQLAHAAEMQGARLSAVFVRSTCVPGTMRRVIAPCFRDGTRDVALAVFPEFLREGRALADQRSPDRFVIGSDTPAAFEIARRLCEGVVAPLVATTPETAELLKMANNALLSTCISFSNEIARIAERLPGVDADAVLAGVCLDRRLADAPITEYLRAGVGFGGSCLGKDLSALMNFAEARGESPIVLHAVNAVNESQPSRFASRLADAAGGVRDKTILVLGLAFKPGTDDVRSSVALPFVAELVRRGAIVRVHDPLAIDPFLRACPGEVRAAIAPSKEWREDAAQSDATVVLTAWPEYRELGHVLATIDRPRVVADGRSLLRGVALPSRTIYVGVGLASPSAS